MEKLYDLNIIKNYLEMYSIHKFFDDDILKRFSIFKFNSSENVINKGMKYDYFYFLVEGKLKVYTIENNGKTLLLRFYKPLEVIGEAEIFTSNEFEAYANATQNSVLLGVIKEDFTNYCEDKPDLLIFIIKSLSKKLYSITNSSSFNLLYPLKNRFAGYLKGMGLLENNLYKEIKADSLKEISELLGASYRHFLRVVNEFEKNKYIINDRGKIKILNYEKINELSMGIYE